MPTNPIFDFRVSRFYVCFMAAALLGSGVMIVLLPIHFIFKLMLGVGLVAYSYLIFKRDILLRDKLSVKSIKKLEEGQWQIATPSGIFESALRGDSLVTNLVSILRFEVKGKVISSVLFRDSLKDDNYRRLIGTIRMR